MVKKLFSNKVVDFATQIDHFSNILTPAMCAITDQEIEQVKQANAVLHTSITACERAQLGAKQARKERDAAVKTVQGIVLPMFRRIKAHPDYTPALGASMGIDSRNTATVVDLKATAPNLSGFDKGGGTAAIRYTKHGSDGVNFYSQREGDADWLLIGRSTVSPFVDSRPLLIPGKPELRRYSAIFVKKDQEIGRASSDLVLTCAP